MAGPDQRVPELRGGVDVRALPLTSLDGFVLSRVDGRASINEIVAMTGLPGEQVVEILARLAELGAVQWQAKAEPPPAQGAPSRSGAPSAAPRRRTSMAPPRRMMSESAISSTQPDYPSRPPPARSSPPSAAPSALPPRGSMAPPSLPHVEIESLPPGEVAGSARMGTTPSMAPMRSEAPLYDERELDEEVALPRERRKQILDLFYRLDKVDYYQVLGVPYDADRKQIRAGYFSLSKAFHPDSMFRKELGSFKAKMTTVFEALTEAYETLGKQQKRDEYDAYLRSTRAIAVAERALSTDAQAPAEVVEIEVPRAPALPTISYGIPEPTPLPSAPRETSPEARRIARELLERRLRAGRVARGDVEPTVVPLVPSDPVVERQSLAKQLTKSLIDAGKLTGTSDKVTRAMMLARDAFERGDVAASVQHISNALSVAPERSDLRAEYERLSLIIAERLASDYVEHARFEAKQGKWASAAASWAKVCEGRPEDSSAHRATAHALLKAGGDLRGAQKYAQQAVFLAPEDVEARILLAQIHLTVGLKLNARRELEAAAKLDPLNEMVKNLSAELKG